MKNLEETLAMFPAKQTRITSSKVKSIRRSIFRDTRSIALKISPCTSMFQNDESRIGHLFLLMVSSDKVFMSISLNMFVDTSLVAVLTSVLNLH